MNFVFTFLFGWLGNRDTYSVFTKCPTISNFHFFLYIHFAVTKSKHLFWRENKIVFFLPVTRSVHPAEPAC